MHAPHLRIVGLIISLAALVRWRREPMPHWASMGVLAAAAVVSGMMAYTGLLGGHPGPGVWPSDGRSVFVVLVTR